MNILFLCVANSARSQMAEGLAKELLGEGHNIQSAGSEPSGKVHDFAVKALDEVGIDISKNQSKCTSDLSNGFIKNLDFAITLCADEVCPVLPSNAKSLHWFNQDPANENYNNEELTKAFEVTRDNLIKSIKEFNKLNVQ
jgi:arsenate reductase (thioredoxin)